MSGFFPLENRPLLTTAQQAASFKSFNFNGRKILLRQETGVCAGNYYIDFGVASLPKALALFEKNRKQVCSVLEAGAGRGVYLNFFGTIPQTKELWGVDIEPQAVRLTAENLEKNGVKKFRLFSEPIEETFKRNWSVDLILHDLPLIPMAENNRLPKPLKTMIGAGRTGRTFVDFIIRNAFTHLTEKGGLFFVQPSFIKGGKEKTRKLLKENGFKVALLEERKKHLRETILTQRLKPFIEKHLNYKFPKDKIGEYFRMQAFLAIKQG